MLHTRRSTPDIAEDEVLRGMFAARKSVFVDLLKWNVPVVGSVFEIDQFDDAHATYLVLADDRGRHLASARLLSTMRPHILGDLFPFLCEAVPPRAPEVHEITRFCLDRRLNARERRLVRDTLVIALADHALLNGITAFTAIAEMGWLQQILSFGWRCTPLGLPVVYEGSNLAAFKIDINEHTPALLRAAGLAAAPELLGAPQLLAA